jgi:tetratricopeptide (TPR) repeat protein
MNAVPDPAQEQAELVQRALAASQAGDSETAICLLQEATGRADATAIAHFLLGSEYAQVRKYDEAMNEIEAAVALDPQLYIARFQLGMLQLSSGQPRRAAITLQPLQGLGSDHALACFATGLLHLMQDQFAACTDWLKRGIGLNADNLPLNEDMHKIIEQVRLTVAANEANGAGGAPTEEDLTHHILLSAYTGHEKKH